MRQLDWLPATESEWRDLQPSFSRIARHQGKTPVKVMVVHSQHGQVVQSAMQYQEDGGKWERWGIQYHPGIDIVESWSTILSWLRPLVGDHSVVIEVYPPALDVVETAPVRWFWVLPSSLFPACNLLANESVTSWRLQPWTPNP